MEVVTRGIQLVCSNGFFTPLECFPEFSLVGVHSCQERGRLSLVFTLLRQRQQKFVCRFRVAALLIQRQCLLVWTGLRVRLPAFLRGRRGQLSARQQLT